MAASAPRGQRHSLTMDGLPNQSRPPTDNAGPNLTTFPVLPNAVNWLSTAWQSIYGTPRLLIDSPRPATRTLHLSGRSQTAQANTRWFASAAAIKVPEGPYFAYSRRLVTHSVYLRHFGKIGPWSRHSNHCQPDLAQTVHAIQKRTTRFRDYKRTKVQTGRRSRSEIHTTLHFTVAIYRRSGRSAFLSAAAA